MKGIIIGVITGAGLIAAGVLSDRTDVKLIDKTQKVNKK